MLRSVALRRSSLPFLTAETTAVTDKGAPLGLAARIALAALRLYKLTLSPMFFAGACRFCPVRCARITQQKRSAIRN